MSDNYNNPVVNFPSVMEVQSPEIEAISESTKAIADVLHNDLEKAVSSLMYLTKLPGYFEGLEKIVTEQFTNLFTNQVEATILNRQANVNVLKNKISYIEEHIKKKEQHVETTNGNITKRYSGITSDMVNEHEHFLKKLDSHVYALTDSIYPKQIQEKFSFNVQPNINYLTSHARESAFVRTICINEDFIKSKNRIDSFLEERQLFDLKLSENAIDTSLNDGNYNIPLLFAEVENIETGEVEVQLICPDDLKSNIHIESWSLIEQLALEKADNIIERNGKDEAVINEICHWMEEHEIPEQEISRFKNDCQTTKMEEQL